MNETRSGTPKQSVRLPVLRRWPMLATDAPPGQYQDRERKRRWLADAFSALDSAARQVEHRLVELGDGADDRDRAHGEVLIAEAHRMLAGPSGDLQQVRNQTGELQHLYCRIASHGTMAGVSEDASPARDG